MTTLDTYSDKLMAMLGHSLHKLQYFLQLTEAQDPKPEHTSWPYLTQLLS